MIQKIDEKTGDILNICEKCGQIHTRQTKQGIIGPPHAHKCTEKPATASGLKT